MLNGISGKPGGGKSYEAVVTHIIKVITVNKRKVVTNLPLNIEHFCSVYGEYCRDLIVVVDGQFHNYGGERPFSKKEHYLQYEDWANEKGQKVYFFIDECHLAMPMQGTDKALCEFYSMHRHYGFDMMLITQNFRKVNRDIRDMIQNHYRAIKKSMMGQDDKYILKIHDGASSSKASEVATHERTYEKKYFAFYQSHTKSDVSVDESKSADIKTWYSHWSIKASVCFFVFAIFIFSKAFSDMSEKPTPKSFGELEPTIEKPVDSNNKGSFDELSPKPSLKKQSPKKPLTERDNEYFEMVAKSKKYHPYYKVSLSISGYAEYKEDGRQTKTVYFSANQNGQHVFTLKSIDLLLAGYDVRVLTACAVRIKYLDYEDFITCDAPRQGMGVPVVGELASN
jgi:zona occludens toxin